MKINVCDPRPCMDCLPWWSRCWPRPVPSGPGWTAEFKWDGIRIVATSGVGRWRAFTRTGRDASVSYPELNVLPELLNGRSAVLDGELVALDPLGVPNFGLLQQRHGARQPGTALVRQVPLKLYLFDLLHLDGESTVAAPYAERRALLAGLGLDGPVAVTPPAFPDATEDVYQAAVNQGIEGVVCKRTDSLYEPGRRSRSWIKTVSVRRSACGARRSGRSRPQCSRPVVCDRCSCRRQQGASSDRPELNRELPAPLRWADAGSLQDGQRKRKEGSGLSKLSSRTRYSATGTKSVVLVVS
jgi:hypothetical protein